MCQWYDENDLVRCLEGQSSKKFFFTSSNEENAHTQKVWSVLPKGKEIADNYRKIFNKFSSIKCLNYEFYDAHYLIIAWQKFDLRNF